MLGSYIVSQSVLILLGRFIASSGYSYRKLQAVVFSIRKESLGNNFGKYFGKNPESFSPYNKGGTFSSNSYLPEFDVIFFVFIICLQFVLAVSLFFKIGTFEHETFRAIVYPKEFFEIDGHIISLPKLWCFYLINIPVLFTCFFQSVYYYKYIKNVKFEQLEDTPEIKIRNEIRKRYHRKIALTRGYFYFYLIFTLMQFTFLLIRITIDCHYMTTIEHTVTLLIPGCLLYTSPSPRDGLLSRMPSSA